jgi:uncharacterized protein YhbP (UPF0306 family)
MAVDIPEEVVRFLSGQKTLTLATVGSDGTPHAASLVFVNEGAAIYIWAHGSSATADQIGDGATVGFAIDDYSDDPRQTKGVQGTGRATPTAGEDMAKAGDLFGTKFPHIRPGASGAVSFFKIEPSELHFIDNSKGDGEPESDEYRRQSFG